MAKQLGFWLALLLECTLARAASAPAALEAAKQPQVAEVKQKVDAALTWIAKAQKPDGSWPTDLGENRPAIVVTTCWCGLALQASGKYPAQVDRAANYVKANLFQDRGPVHIPPEMDQGNWKIGIGGLFLCEHFAALKRANPTTFQSRAYELLLEQIVAECFKRMEPSGGWGHTPTVKNLLGYVELEIMSNWMLATVGACQRLNARVPAADLDKAIHFVEDCCNPGQGAVGYSPRVGQKGIGDPSRTGGAIFAFAMLGQQERPLYPLMVASWKQEMDQSGEGHGSVAMGLLGSALGARQIGPEEWKDFQATFFRPILGNARPDGSFKHLTGTTPKAVGFDHMIGSAYNTGIYALLLQLDSRNLRFLGRRQSPRKEGEQDR